jgi:hypothetical protein
LALVLAAAVLAPLSSPAAAADSNVQAKVATERQPMSDADVSRTFAEAVRMFNSATHLESARLFAQIIDQLSPRLNRLTTDLRNVLVRSLSCAAQLALDLDETANVDEAVKRLIEVDPAFRFDSSFSLRLTEMLERARRQMVGTLVLPVTPKDADMFVDGVKVPTGQVSVDVMIGLHSVEVRSPGYVSQTKQVQVDANQKVRVEIVLERSR